MTYDNAIPTTPIEIKGVVGWVVSVETNYAGTVMVGVFDTLADAKTYGKHTVTHDEWDVMPIMSSEGNHE